MLLTRIGVWSSMSLNPYKWDNEVRDSDRFMRRNSMDDFDRRFNSTERLIKTSFWAIPLAFVLLLIVGGAVYFVALKSSEKTVTFKVIDKESVTVSSGSGDSLEVHNEYRVYTDHGTYKVTDTLIYGRFSSADAYGKLQRGHTYTCKTAGWRFGLFSWFPNLIKCSEAKAGGAA